MLHQLGGDGGVGGPLVAGEVQLLEAVVGSYDSVVVDAYKTANKPLVPIVGADNNGFLKQMLNDKELDGAAVTNPAVIGGPRHGDGVLIIIVWANANPQPR